MVDKRTEAPKEVDKGRIQEGTGLTLHYRHLGDDDHRVLVEAPNDRQLHIYQQYCFFLTGHSRFYNQNEFSFKQRWIGSR